MFNKFKPEFRELLSVKGRDAEEIDYMNLKRFYFDYLNILKQGIDKYEDLQDNKEIVHFEVNEFITRRLNRQIFQLCEPTPVDVEILRKLQRMSENGETDLVGMDIPDEMKDENLWTEAVSTFDTIVKEDTPYDKRQVIFRTMHIAK